MLDLLDALAHLSLIAGLRTEVDVVLIWVDELEEESIVAGDLSEESVSDIAEDHLQI